MWIPLEQLTFLCHAYINTYSTNKVTINSDESFPVDQFHMAKQFRNMGGGRLGASRSTLYSTRNMQRYILNMKQDIQCMYNVTLRNVHATTVAMEKQ
jgi:hypothetical protein